IYSPTTLYHVLVVTESIHHPPNCGLDAGNTPIQFIEGTGMALRGTDQGRNLLSMLLDEFLVPNLLRDVRLEIIKNGDCHICLTLIQRFCIDLKIKDPLGDCTTKAAQHHTFVCLRLD